MFFFSNFPHGLGEKDMIKVFQKWARVKDVFISRRLNKWGKRFGFVRFFVVRDERSLERDLDQIYIGSRKLYVNIPKYRRYQYGPKKEERRASWELPRERQVIARKSDTKEDEIVRKHGGKEIWVEKSGKRTYAEAVSGEYQDGWKGVAFKTQHLSLPWMKRSVVGTLDDGMDFGMLGEEIRDVVWLCDGSKSPGPDGFNMNFIKKSWGVLKDDIVVAAAFFHENGHIPKGCNASFVALIPKVQDPVMLEQYRPISLVGAVYKIISKVLA